MIPHFPLFKNLESTDKTEIENVASQFLPYAEYQFATMRCWEIHQPFQVSVINNNLLIKQTNCLTGDYFFSLVGTNALPQTMKVLADFFKQQQLSFELRCVPEETVKSLDKAQFSITEDRDNFDYIFSVSDFFHVKGNKFKIYRHRISAFNKENPDISIRLIDLTQTKIKEQIIKVFQEWENIKGLEKKECEAVCEFRAVNKLLSSTHEFDTLVALGVFDKDEMIAFSINDINNEKYMTGLFWKANTVYKGIYQFLMNEIIKFSHSRGIEFLNWESDLGIESLRRSKMNLHPVFFLKKYTVAFSEI